jgi:hypothetical protein
MRNIRIRANLRSTEVDISIQDFELLRKLEESIYSNISGNVDNMVNRLINPDIIAIALDNAIAKIKVDKVYKDNVQHRPRNDSLVSFGYSKINIQGDLSDL